MAQFDYHGERWVTEIWPLRIPTPRWFDRSNTRLGHWVWAYGRHWRVIRHRRLRGEVTD